MPVLTHALLRVFTPAPSYVPTANQILLYIPYIGTCLGYVDIHVFASLSHLCRPKRDDDGGVCFLTLLTLALLWQAARFSSPHPTDVSYRNSSIELRTVKYCPSKE